MFTIITFHFTLSISNLVLVFSPIKRDFGCSSGSILSGIGISRFVGGGADFVGAEDLVEKVLGGWTDFDAAVATPDLMGMVGKVAKVLGPRGLLPNKKTGTVTNDVASIVSDLKKGRVSFRNDKGGVVHAPFGKISFGVDKLLDNLSELIRSVKSSKPAMSKGKFIRKIVVSSTMGVGVNLSPDEVV